MLPKVFLDTNIINNPTPTGQLFGNRQQLKCLQEKAVIIVPQVVVDELMKHKRQAFEEEKAALLKNKLLDDPEERAKYESREFCADCILWDEEIQYSVEDIHNHEKFVNVMRKLALENKAPFEPTSDKGFNDALVAFTIEDYIERNPDDKPVILVSKDGRLGEYFEGREEEVIVVKKFDELWNNIDERFGCEESLPEAAGKAQQHKEQCQDNAIITKLPPQLAAARRLLSELRNSGCFATTHDIIAKLQPFKRFLTDDDYVDILLSAINNNQIMAIINDTDVKDFIKPIFDKYHDKLSTDQYNNFVTFSAWHEYPLIREVEKLKLEDLPF